RWTLAQRAQPRVFRSWTCSGGVPSVDLGGGGSDGALGETAAPARAQSQREPAKSRPNAAKNSRRLSAMRPLTAVPASRTTSSGTWQGQVSAARSRKLSRRIPCSSPSRLTVLASISVVLAANDGTGEDVLRAPRDHAIGEPKHLADRPIGETVVHVLPLAARLDEPAPAETHQVAADAPLTAADGLDELAHRPLALTEETQNPHSCPIGQGLEEAGLELGARVGLGQGERRRLVWADHSVLTSVNSYIYYPFPG